MCIRLLTLIITIGLCACADKPIPPFEISLNAPLMIASNEGKTWKLARRFNKDTRMNMGDCFLHYRVTYRLDGTMNDNNGEASDCGSSLNGRWNIIKSKKGHSYIKIDSDQLQELMGIDKNYMTMKILGLSDEQMTLQFRHNQTTSRRTTITDIYVPEDTEIADREFHW